MSIPVLLLHGAIGAATQLEPLKNNLEARGKKVYSMDFSGHHGKSFSKNGFGIEVFAGDVIDFLDKENVEAVDIFGYSMGGYVALWLAHQHPIRVNCLITLGTKFDWNPESAEREINKMDPEKIQVKVPAFARLLEHRHAPNDWKELLHKTSQMMFDLGQGPMLTEKIFSQITQKTKILLGENDDMADLSYSQKVASWLSNGEFHLLEHTPHPIEKVNLEVLVNFID